MQVEIQDQDSVSGHPKVTSDRKKPVLRMVVGHDI